MPADTLSPVRDAIYVPLIMMTSFARSGETMMLRALNAHPRIEVVSQILDADEPPQDVRLFEALQDYPDFVLRRANPLLAHRSVGPDSIVIVKHGIWTHRWPHIDFVLARNPFAIVKSLRQYAIDNHEDEQHRRHRLARWAGKIDASLVPLCLKGDETEAIAYLYRSKMLARSTTRLGVVRYEDFVAAPEREMPKVLRMMKLPWDERVLRAHENYPQGKIGHGKIKLWEAIRLTPHKPETGLPQREFDIIASITRPVLDLYGYAARDGRVELL